MEIQALSEVFLNFFPEIPKKFSSNWNLDFYKSDSVMNHARHTGIRGRKGFIRESFFRKSKIRARCDRSSCGM